MPRASLSEIVRAFGVEPAAILLASKRHNTHWRVRAADGGLYFLRRFGEQPDLDADAAWEFETVRDLSARGWPVSVPVQAPRWIDGRLYTLLPHISERQLGKGSSDPAGYVWLGRQLAVLHMRLEGLAPPRQRPGWTELQDGARTRPGQPPREDLLNLLRRHAPARADQLQAAIEALEARRLHALFADAPRQIVHGDFSPWNVLRREGRLTGVLDFELAHVDIAAADLAFARRGSHNAVVEGYLQVRPLPEGDLEALDALWTGAVLTSAWLELTPALEADRLEPGALDWPMAQLEKTFPYRGRAPH